MIRIIIAGSREFNDYGLLNRSVFDIIRDLRNNRIKEEHPIEFISGTARVADQLGKRMSATGLLWDLGLSQDFTCDQTISHALYLAVRKLQGFSNENIKKLM